MSQSIGIEILIVSWYFSFFCERYRIRVSADRFPHVTLFIDFIYSNAHFDSVFSNTVQCNRKMLNTVRFSIMKLRISTNFINFRSKLASKICEKAWSLGGKTNQNHHKMDNLSPFSSKNRWIN